MTDLVKSFPFERRTADCYRNGKVWIYYIVHRTQHSSNLRDPFAFAFFLLKMNTILQNLPNPVNYCMEREFPPPPPPGIHNTEK